MAITLGAIGRQLSVIMARSGYFLCFFTVDHSKAVMNLNPSLMTHQSLNL